jgi:hypothetical protein
MSWLCGIYYSNAFTLGLVIQAVVNYKNKSTIGFSTDFAIIALAGYIMLQFNQTVGIVDPFTDAGRVHIMDMWACTTLVFMAAV